MTKSILHSIVEQSPRLAASTRDKYLRDLNAWVMFAGEDPRGWSRKNTQDFYNSMLYRGLKPQSANRVIASVAYASKQWAANEQDPKLDFASIELAKPKPPQKRSQLTESEASRMLVTCVSDDPSVIDIRDFALLVVMLETGMRRMSIMSMQLATTQLHYDAVVPHTLILLKGQDSTLYDVPLSDTACAALRPWIAYLQRRGIKHGPVFRSLWRNGGDYTISETALGASAIANIVTARTDEAKLGRNVHPHLFRYTFVTWRMTAGYLPHEIAAMTGHKIKGLGALGGYIDIDVYRERIRSSTPAFLRQLVRLP